jgi:hypothetical protein
LQTQYNGTDIDANEFLGKTVVSYSGGSIVRAKVVAIDTTGTNPVLVLKYVSGERFLAGDTIRVYRQEIFATLGKNKIDVVFGIRSSRQDPIISQILSNIFWFIYRLLIDRDMPKGGVDIFGCNSIFRTELVQLNETRSSLVGLAFWLGFERGFVKYDRLTREKGKSSWTLSKKINYFLDTLYSFTDLPIRILIFVGGTSILFSVIFASIIAIFRVYGLIEVPGYTATILMLVFFGGLNMFGLGIVGNYTWRVYENSKNRPTEIISRVYTNGK